MFCEAGVQFPVERQKIVEIIYLDIRTSLCRKQPLSWALSFHGVLSAKQAHLWAERRVCGCHWKGENNIDYLLILLV